MAYLTGQDENDEKDKAKAGEIPALAVSGGTLGSSIGKPQASVMAEQKQPGSGVTGSGRYLGIESFINADKGAMAKKVGTLGAGAVGAATTGYRQLADPVLNTTYKPEELKKDDVPKVVDEKPTSLTGLVSQKFDGPSSIDYNPYTDKHLNQAQKLTNKGTIGETVHGESTGKEISYGSGLRNLDAALSGSDRGIVQAANTTKEGVKGFADTVVKDNATLADKVKGFATDAEAANAANRQVLTDYQKGILADIDARAKARNERNLQIESAPLETETLDWATNPDRHQAWQESFVTPGSIADRGNTITEPETTRLKNLEAAIGGDKVTPTSPFVESTVGKRRNVDYVDPKDGMDLTTIGVDTDGLVEFIPTLMPGGEKNSAGNYPRVPQAYNGKHYADIIDPTSGKLTPKQIWQYKSLAKTFSTMTMKNKSHQLTRADAYNALMYSPMIQKIMDKAYDHYMSTMMQLHTDTAAKAGMIR